MSTVVAGAGYRGRAWLAAIAALFGLILIAGAALLWGSGDGAVVGRLLAPEPLPEAYRYIVVDLRLPRLLAAALAGLALALAGTILQTVTGNPLADPGLLGVNHGAALAVILGMLLWPALPVTLSPLLALLGGIGGVAVLVWLAAGSRSPRMVWILGGVGLAAFAAAAVSMAVAMVETQRLGAVLAWLAGSVYGVDWRDIAAFAPWICALALVAWAMAGALDALALGRDTAWSVGCRVAGAERLLLLLAAALAGSAVAIAGAVAFIGLVAPHAARTVAGQPHRRLLPVAALFGALLATGADTVVRLAFAPAQIPFGVAVSMIGLPVFLVFLLRRSDP